MNIWDMFRGFGSAFQTPLFTINQTPVTVSSLILFVGVLLAFLIANRILATGHEPMSGADQF